MQLAVRIALLCTILGVAGVFVPVGEVVIKTPVSTHQRAASLWELGGSKDAARTFLRNYRGSLGKKLGAKMLDKVAPRLPDRLQGHAMDLQDAMATLDNLKDEDIEKVGTATVAITWGFLGLNVALALLVYGLGATSGKLRLATASFVALLTAIVGAALYVVMSTVVTEANAEIGRPVFALRSGAYLLGATSVGALAAMIIATIGYARTRARMAPPSPPPA